MAQAPLPDEVLQAQPLSQADQVMVREYVLQAVKELHSPDSQTAQSARDTLIEPVLKETSVGFRLFYSEQALPGLDVMIMPGADTQRAQLALAVAGAVATDAAADRLSKALEDPRPAVRFGAVREMGVLLGQVDNGRAAMQADRARTTIAALFKALSAEKNIFVASEFAQTLAIPVNTESLQEAALAAMCSGMADQVVTRQKHAARDASVLEEIVVFLRAASAAQESLIKRQIKGKTSQRLNTAAGRLANASRAYAELASANPALKEDGRKLVAQLRTAASNLHQLATGSDN